MTQTKSQRVLDAVPAGRWLEGPTADDTVAAVAMLQLAARIRTVAHWLPLAAERYDEDIEYVHQLRVSTRRAFAVLRTFRRLVPKPHYRQMRDTLREIRRAAGAARDCDVLLARLAHVGGERPSGVWDYLVDRLAGERAAAQRPIQAVGVRCTPESFEQWLTGVGPAAMKAESPKLASQRFGAAAKRFLKKPRKTLVKACGADLHDPVLLHALRVAGKKFRYTIEVVWPAYGPALRNDVYPLIETLQEFLGRINDHVQMAARWESWFGAAPTIQLKRFLEGLLVAERLAVDDLRALFFAWWAEADLVSHLKKIHRAK